MRDSSQIWHKDHPRIRGEHPWPCAIRFAPGGSSPHTRGALGILFAIMIQFGIIPAYAGSTLATMRSEVLA